MAYIQGYLATITVNGVEYAPDTSTAGLTRSSNTIDVTPIGVTAKQYLVGLQDGTITADTHMNTTTMAGINTAYESTTPVTFIFRPGSIAAGKDAGQYSGSAIISNMDANGDATGEWDVALDLQITGTVTYTAPA